MIGYASHTGTLRNLAAIRDHGWRLLVSASALRTDLHGLPYALDNGAWSAHLNGRPFDEDSFARAYEALGRGADFVVAPDIVAGGLASLELSARWLPRLGAARLVLVPVQDGMAPRHILSLISGRVGIFVGGTTEWKLGTLMEWGALARSVGCYLHVGRVNTARRIAACGAAGADSFDGTSATMYATTLPELDWARRRRDMFGEREAR